MMLYRYQDIQIMHLHLPFLADIAKLCKGRHSVRYRADRPASAGDQYGRGSTGISYMPTRKPWWRI